MAIIQDIYYRAYGVWRSLKGQYVQSGGAMRLFGAGSGVRKNGVWYVLPASATPLYVYGSPNVRVNKDGLSVWAVTISTDPDVFANYLAGLTVSGALEFTDGSNTSFSGYVDGDNNVVYTDLEYNGQEYSFGSLGAVPDSADYVVVSSEILSVYAVQSLQAGYSLNDLAGGDE